MRDDLQQKMRRHAVMPLTHTANDSISRQVRNIDTLFATPFLKNNTYFTGSQDNN